MEGGAQMPKKLIHIVMLAMLMLTQVGRPLSL